MLLLHVAAFSQALHLDVEAGLKTALRSRGRKPAVGVELSPAPPAPGLEFMQGIMVVGASEKLRDSGASLVVCTDLDTLRSVADEQKNADSVRQVVVAYEGDDLESASEAGAAAALVRNSDDAETCRKQGLAVVVAADDLAAGLELCASLDAPALVVPAVSEAPPDRECCVLVRASLDSVMDVARSVVDHNCDGLLLKGSDASPAELADALADRVRDLRSGKSKTYDFATSTGSTQLDYTDEQRDAIAWGKFVQNSKTAGLVDEFQTPDNLDTEKGDHVGF